MTQKSSILDIKKQQTLPGETHILIEVEEEQRARLLYSSEPSSFEYFCNNCGQMRLSFTGKKVCGNCGSSNIVIGKPGELDKATLKEQFSVNKRKELKE